MPKRKAKLTTVWFDALPGMSADLLVTFHEVKDQFFGEVEKNHHAAEFACNSPQGHKVLYDAALAVAGTKYTTLSEAIEANPDLEAVVTAFQKVAPGFAFQKGHVEQVQNLPPGPLGINMFEKDYEN